MNGISILQTLIFQLFSSDLLVGCRLFILSKSSLLCFPFVHSQAINGWLNRGHDAVWQLPGLSETPLQSPVQI